MRWQLDDLPPHMREQARQQIAPDEPAAPAAAMPPAAKPPPAAKISPPKAPRLTMAAPPAEDEEDVQAQAISCLSRAGFLVLQTSVRYHSQQCEGCGKWARPRGGTGTTPGVPDLLVTREEWPQGLFAGIEMKDADGGLTVFQELLAARGRLWIARTAGDALLEAQACSAEIVAALPPAYVSPERVAAAEAKVQKYKEAQQRRAAAKKVRR